MRSLLGPFAVVVVLASGPIAAGTAIVPVGQQRSLDAFVIVPQCEGKAFDADMALDFDPFTSAIETGFDCDSGFGLATARQDSRIDASGLSGSGGCRARPAAGRC